MNKKPVSYLQTDARWKNKPYRVKGETSTIGGSGCGPTAAAMLLSTLTGKSITPVETCAWAVEHGYKALHQGTYYGYFAPQFAAFGIKCWQLNWVNAYHNPKATSFDETVKYVYFFSAVKELKKLLESDMPAPPEVRYAICYRKRDRPILRMYPDVVELEGIQFFEYLTEENDSSN